MASPKWFDLSGLDAKIERVGLGRGVFNLRLELAAERLDGMDDADLLDAGWVEEDPANGRRVLVNHRTMNDMRSIADSLTPFFSRDEIIAARAPQDAMRQNERMDGLSERRIIEEVELADQVAMVTPTDRDRIMRSVMGAVVEQKKQMAAERGLPLNGRGMEVYRDLVDSVSRERSLEFAADGGVAFLVKVSRPTTDGEDPMATAEHSTALTYLRLKDSGNDPVAEGAALASLRDFVLSMPRPREVASQLMANAKNSGAAHDLRIDAAVLGGEIPVSVVGGEDVKLSERRSIESVLRDLPFKSIRDNSMPTRDVANYATALTRATRFVADRLGLEADDLIPDQGRVPLRFNIGNVLYGKDLAAGVMRSQSVADAGQLDDDGKLKRNAVTIAVSLRTPGTFVHELGHAIDFGNNFTPEVREGLLERAGLLHRIHGEIGEHYGQDDAYGKYLRSSAEIFARVFESAMVNHALHEGDLTLGSVGGLYAVHRTDGFAARGDHEATEEFLKGLSEELRQRRSRVYDMAQGNEAASESRPPEPANAATGSEMHP